MDWDNFSEFHVGSQLLKPFVDFEVDCIGAIAENVIRVALYNEDFCGVKGYFPMPCKVGDTRPAFQASCTAVRVWASSA